MTPTPNDNVHNGQVATDNAVETDKNVDEGVLKEMLSLQASLQNSDKMKATEKTAQNTNVLNAIFKILMEVLIPQVKEIKSSVTELKNFQVEVSEKVTSLKAENESLKRRILDLEMNRCRKSLIIKNLKIKTKKGEAENQFSLKKNFEGILDRMTIKNQVKIEDIFRFKANPEGNQPNKIMPVKVSFCSILDKNAFMANLGKLKNSDFGAISAVIDVPKCLLPAYIALDEIGYRFRKENLQSRVNIGFKGYGLALYGRLKDETKYKIIKEMA